MEVQLTPQLERLVHEKVQSGRYGSASEVVCEALLLLEEREEARVAELGRLQSRIDQSLLEAERGEVTDGDEFMEGLLGDRSQESGVRTYSCKMRSGGWQ